MYDVEKGIYPEGQYFVGEDIPLGKYIFTPKDEEISYIIVYDTYQSFKNGNNEITYQSISGEYFMNLREWGLYVVVNGANFRKV